MTSPEAGPYCPPLGGLTYHTAAGASLIGSPTEAASTVATPPDPSGRPGLAVLITAGLLSGAGHSRRGTRLVRAQSRSVLRDFAGGGNAETSIAMRTDAPFTGLKFLDVQPMPIRAVESDTHTYCPIQDRDFEPCRRTEQRGPDISRPAGNQLITTNSDKQPLFLIISGGDTLGTQPTGPWQRRLGSCMV